MAAGTSLDCKCVLLLLCVFLLALASNGVPVSRTRNLMVLDESSYVHDQLISPNTNSLVDSWEIVKMGGRLNYLEVNDYPGSGANNRHTPKGHR